MSTIMGLFDIFKDRGLPILGGYWNCKCPKCGTEEKVYKGDLICWGSFKQYAMARGYPKCPNCGADMKESLSLL